jgi:predicted DNA-binding WGR domain protein
LDGVLTNGEDSSMTETSGASAHKLQMLVLERRDPSRNVARYYVLAIEPTLFGDAALSREWGRIGFMGRRRLDLHVDSPSAREALNVWLERKVRRGYRISGLNCIP